MASPIADRAAADILRYGRALCKYISANDTGKTGSHQTGYYLPKGEWRLFALKGPVKGENHKRLIKILWHDGRTTESCVTWYGRAKNEYRLTRFGRGFPWLAPENIGNLLILIPAAESGCFLAYILDDDNDIAELQAHLGIEITGKYYAVYPPPGVISPSAGCIEECFRKYVETLADFPAAKEFSTVAQTALTGCLSRFTASSYDSQLFDLVSQEYELFKMAERALCGKSISRPFRDIDEFLKTASSIMNRRKVRAGCSFENHVAYILRQASVKFDSQPAKIPGKPDIVIPSAKAYFDTSYPRDKIIILGVKTTCKDRWRQLLQEGPGITKKHLITMQRGISASQIDDMTSKHVRLIVPKGLHTLYPMVSREHLLSVDEFVAELKRTISL